MRRLASRGQTCPGLTVCRPYLAKLPTEVGPWPRHPAHLCYGHVAIRRDIKRLANGEPWQTIRLLLQSAAGLAEDQTASPDQRRRVSRQESWGCLLKHSFRFSRLLRRCAPKFAGPRRRLAASERRPLGRTIRCCQVAKHHLLHWPVW